MRSARLPLYGYGPVLPGDGRRNRPRHLNDAADISAGSHDRRRSSLGASFDSRPGVALLVAVESLALLGEERSVQFGEVGAAIGPDTATLRTRSDELQALTAERCQSSYRAGFVARRSSCWQPGCHGRRVIGGGLRARGGIPRAGTEHVSDTEP